MMTRCMVCGEPMWAGPSDELQRPCAPCQIAAERAACPAATPEPILCYVKDAFLYFTTQPLAEQWGDDWDDAPYECNAGDPYETVPGSITVIAYRGDFGTPDLGHWNSPYSVQDINGRAIPWLISRPWADEDVARVKVWAGTPYSDVIAAIQRVGGMVLAPISGNGQG